MRLLLILILLITYTTGVAHDGHIQFIKNHGQWNDPSLYKADIPGGHFFITSTSLVFLFKDAAKISDIHHRKIRPSAIDMHAYKMSFVGSAKMDQITQRDPSTTKYNFFLGSDNSKWVSGMNAYSTLTIHELYKGVDLELEGKHDQIKSTYYLEPGIDPDVIQIEYEGMEDLFIKDGELYIITSLGQVKELKPVAYQAGQQSKKTIEVKYKLKGNIVSFEFPNGYDPSRELILDPDVVFATYSGSFSDNFGFTGTYDDDGHSYSGGTVYGARFPVTIGAYQSAWAGGSNTSEPGAIARDAGILKYSPDGSQLLYATYIGGGHNEQPHSMVVDYAGNLIVYGTTYSQDFPVRFNAAQSALKGGADIFLSKFSNDGSQLLASTFLGGVASDGLNGSYRAQSPVDYYNNSPLGYNYGDYFRGEVIVDSQNNVYLATCSKSNDFPVVNAAQSFLGGRQDGVACKLNPGLSNIIWSTFVGGSADDAVYSIHLDAKNNAYVAGGTMSPNLGFSGAYQENYRAGPVDGFIVRIAADGSSFLAGTYLGTNEYDQIYFVQLDLDGDVYVTGQTRGNWPVKNAPVAQAGTHQFINKLNPELTEVIYSSTFGSERNLPDLSPSAFLVDICENVYFSGWGGSSSDVSRGAGTSTKGLQVTGNAYQKTTDGSDFYLIVFRKGMDSVLYASYFGGGLSGEHADGGTSRFDKKGIVYQSVCGGCRGNSDFPVTENAWSRSNNSSNCNNAFFKINLDVANNAPRLVGTDKDNILQLEINATDTLRRLIRGRDNNIEDSLYATFYSVAFDTGSIDPPFASIKNVSGIANVSSELFWPTSCVHAGDTFDLEVNLQDNGCPVPKNTNAIIRVVVKDPPVFDPPGVFCLYVIDSNTLRVQWDDYEYNQYFEKLNLYKEGSGQALFTLDAFADTSVKSVVDDKATDHYNETYCYSLQAINVCNVGGDTSYVKCTGPNNSEIPDPIYFKYASVKDNKVVEMEWNPSLEDDFHSFLVLKSPNKDPYTYSVYDSVLFNNGYYIDSAVQVNRESYCYEILVRDLCGYTSPPSNEACNIVLKGESVPFEHLLSWNPYKNWENNVHSYKIERSDPIFDKNFTEKDIIDGAINRFTDDSLNYDVGIYKYRVVAFSDEGNMADSSYSNEIELIQSPIIRVPNAFTPNADGINDNWNIADVFVKEFHIQVYNRWGEKVFESNDKNEKWEGVYRSLNETSKMDNVFVYLIRYTGWDKSVKFERGIVTMIK